MNLLTKSLIVSGLLALVRAGSICFPGEDLSQCGIIEKKSTTEKPTEKPPTKIKSRLWRPCFGTNSGNELFYGECRFKNRGCAGKQFSTARTCGKRLVCCDDSSSEAPPRVETKTNFKTSSSSQLSDSSLNLPRCGTPILSYVVGGVDAAEGEFPFMVSFVQKTSQGLENFCGGALITYRHVLTAAHCFDKYPKLTWTRNRNIDVRIGITNLQKEELRGAKSRIADITYHPDFERRSRGFVNPVNDIAIVTLRRAVTSSSVVPACLPTLVDTQTLATKSVLLGWGANSTTTRDSVDQLQKAYVPLTTRSGCQAAYNKLLRSSGYRANIDRHMFCAGNNQTDSCAGDSGSPLLWRDDKFRLAVVGIVSFGPSKCASGTPGVYTKVRDYLEWIANTIAS